MNLTLRAKLRLPAGCSDEQLQDACRRYYAIYQGVLDSASDESVKAIARSKLEDLITSAEAEHVILREADSYAWGTAVLKTPASVEAELSRLGGDGKIAESKANQLTGMIAQLPDSAKRNYLSALVTLHSQESSVDTYREVATKLQSAVTGDPQNPVYPAMIDDIEQEISRHIGELTLWREERQKELDAIRRKEITKQVFSTIGTVLLWIAGAAFTVASVVLSCMCSACEGC